MPGSYKTFNVWDEDEYGNRTAAASESIVLYNVTKSATPTESPLTTDGNGNIAAGSLSAADAGDIVQFSYLQNGIGAHITQKLT